MKYIIKANERDSKGNKYCYTCQSWKPETEFNKDNSKIDKLASHGSDIPEETKQNILGQKL